MEEHYEWLVALVYPYFCTGRPEDKQLAKGTLLGGTVASLMTSEGCCLLLLLLLLGVIKPARIVSDNMSSL